MLFHFTWDFMAAPLSYFGYWRWSYLNDPGLPPVIIMSLLWFGPLLGIIILLFLWKRHWINDLGLPPVYYHHLGAPVTDVKWDQ